MKGLFMTEILTKRLTLYLLSAMVIGISLILPQPAAAQTACPANGGSFCEATTTCAGLNAGSFGFGSLDKPFIDLMRGAGVSVEGFDPASIGKNADIPLDENNYPVILARTIQVIFYANTAATFTTDMMPSGTYVVLWDGQADGMRMNGPGVSNVEVQGNRMQFDLNTRVVGNSFFSYQNASAADTVRNIRIVSSEYETDYADWNWSEYRIGALRNPPLFHPQWIEKMSNACTIRYVSARSVNDADAVTFGRDSLQTRVNLAGSTWLEGFGLGADAIVSHIWPWALIVEATRVTNTRPWINLRVMAYENLLAGDRLIPVLAEMFHRFYGGAIYMEYGNEIWNVAYPFNVATNHVRLNGPGTRDDLAENHSLRNNVIQKAFADAYGDDQCLAIGVLASQGRNPFLGQQMLSFADTQYVDVLSPTTYVGDNLEPGNATWNFVEGLYDQVELGTLNENQAFVQLRDEILTGSNGVINRNWRNDVGPFTQSYIDMADGAGICSAFYEAGLHMRVDNIDVENPQHLGVRSFMRDYQRSIHQAAVEREVMGYLRVRSTGPNILFSSFDNSGGGTFSYWDSVFEPIARQAPRAEQLSRWGDGGGTGVVNKAAVTSINVELLRVERRLENAVDRVFKTPSAQRQLIGFSRMIRRAARFGEQATAASLLQTFQARVDGCGTRADADDLLLACGMQLREQASLEIVEEWVERL